MGYYKRPNTELAMREAQRYFLVLVEMWGLDNAKTIINKLRAKLLTYCPPPTRKI